MPLSTEIAARSYEEREPIEVRITREEMVIVSYPGPDRSLRLADLQAGRAVARRYRRIGEFLNPKPALGDDELAQDDAANGLIPLKRTVPSYP